MSAMRLQRWLAACGVASRRASEKYITEGRVTVNGRVVTELGTKVDPERDDVRVDGERARAPQRRMYVALHKPPGVVCTASDPAGRPRAIDLVQVPARLFPVGRLDEESEGLLLLTDDGDFAQRVTHPRYEVPKVYRVVVKGEPAPDALAKLREGVWLAEGKAAPAEIRILRQTRELTTLALTLREGKNREVRRMLARVELPVKRLMRVRIGPVILGTLKRGQWRTLTEFEVRALLEGPRASRPPARGRAAGGRHDRASGTHRLSAAGSSAREHRHRRPGRSRAGRSRPPRPGHR